MQPPSPPAILAIGRTTYTLSSLPSPTAQLGDPAPPVRLVYVVSERTGPFFTWSVNWDPSSSHFYYTNHYYYHCQTKGVGSSGALNAALLSFCKRWTLPDYYDPAWLAQARQMMTDLSAGGDSGHGCAAASRRSSEAGDNGPAAGSDKPSAQDAPKQDDDGQDCECSHSDESHSHISEGSHAHSHSSDAPSEPPAMELLRAQLEEQRQLSASLIEQNRDLLARIVALSDEGRRSTEGLTAGLGQLTQTMQELSLALDAERERNRDLTASLRERDRLLLEKSLAATEAEADDVRLKIRMLQAVALHRRRAAEQPPPQAEGAQLHQEAWLQQRVKDSQQRGTES